MMSSGPHTLDNAISTLVPAVLRVLRKMKRCWWDAITGMTLSVGAGSRIRWRRDRPPDSQHGAHFRSEDWYGDDLGAARFVECTFTDVDLSEATHRRARCSSGAPSTAGVSTRRSHTATAFVGCDFRRTSFFDATLDGCKLVGTHLLRVRAAAAHRDRRVVARRDHPRHEPVAARPDRRRPPRGRPLDVRPDPHHARPGPARPGGPARRPTSTAPTCAAPASTVSTCRARCSR